MAEISFFVVSKMKLKTNTEKQVAYKKVLAGSSIFVTQMQVSES